MLYVQIICHQFFFFFKKLPTFKYLLQKNLSLFLSAYESHGVSDFLLRQNEKRRFTLQEI